MRLTLILLLATAIGAAAFAVPQQTSVAFVASATRQRRQGAPILSSRTSTILHERISDERRKKLGIGEGEDEYDLGVALANSTDPFISKVVAGSLLLTIFALLVVGVIIPSLTDYGEGVCNPLLTAGRC